MEPSINHMGALNCVGLAKDQALIEAARTEDLHELAKLMVDRGTAVVDELGMNPLMIGAARGNLAMVFMCLRHGARIDAIDKWANTALHHAAQGGHLYVVWLLLKWKADPLRLNKRGDSALALARDAEYTELDEFLVKWIAGEKPTAFQWEKFNRKCARAEAAVKRAEAGVEIHPRKLRRLAWRANVNQSSLFETAPNRSPTLFKQTPTWTSKNSQSSPGHFTTAFLLAQSSQWPPYRPPPGKLAAKVKAKRSPVSSPGTSKRSVVPVGV